MRGLYVILCALGAAAVVIVLSIVRPGAVTQLDLHAYDELLRRTARPPTTGRVSIVAVDEKSIAEIGQWPWSRDVVAELVERLRDLGARVIAFDIILSEPDRLGRPRPKAMSAGEVASTTTDATLAAALAHQRAVTSYAFTFDATPGNAKNCVLHPLPAVQVTAPGQVSPAHRLFQPSGVICSLSVFNQAAGASGFLNVSLDTDGVVRRVPLMMEYRGELYPSLGLAAVQQLLGAPLVTLSATSGHRLTLDLAGQTIPTRSERLSVASLSRTGAHDPICWRFGRARRAASRWLVRRSDRLRWWHGGGGERPGLDAARHVVPRPRGARNRGREPARA